MKEQPVPEPGRPAAGEPPLQSPAVLVEGNATEQQEAAAISRRPAVRRREPATVGLGQLPGAVRQGELFGDLGRIGSGSQLPQFFMHRLPVGREELPQFRQNRRLSQQCGDHPVRIVSLPVPHAPASLARCDGAPFIRFSFSASPTFSARPFIVNGFCRKWTPWSSTPWWEMMLAV